MAEHREIRTSDHQRITEVDGVPFTDMNYLDWAKVRDAILAKDPKALVLTYRQT